jgi:tetratricopeptide (TPR) repeat protein
MGFQGSVESFSLADVFQNLAMNQQTGSLRVSAPDGRERHLCFDGGQVKSLSRGVQKPLLLGEILIGRGVTTEQQLSTALDRQKQTGAPLGACVVELGVLAQAQVDELVAHQIEEEVYELFAWEKATYEFKEGAPEPGLFTDRTGSLSLPISQLIMEAARRVDEWERLRQQVPSLREVYVVEGSAHQAIETGQLELEPVERRLLSLLNGQRDVEDLVEDSFLFRFEVIQALAGFLQSSLIRPAGPAELAEAAEKLKEAGQLARRAKILERLLTLGGDRPEVRRELAEALIQTNEGEKAAIHFSVLAEAELEAGREDGAVALYRRILQSVPNHLASRERLGGIYARRGQKREAVIQFQELMKAYSANGQWAEARGACLRALECEPQHVELRRELVQVYQAEGNKADAARECESLGDLLVRQGQHEAAAKAYRQGMQIAPGQAHLKRKLTDVMLTEEDRRARTRRHLVILLVLVAVGPLVAVLALREMSLAAEVERLHARARSLASEAAGLERQERFKEAADRYEDAARIYDRSGLIRKWGLRGTAEQASQALVHYIQQRDAALDRHRQIQNIGQTGGKKDLERALSCYNTDDLYAAREAFQRVAANTFASAEQRAEADKHLALLRGKIQAFEDGLMRLNRPPHEAFSDVIQEYRFKEVFLASFRRVRPPLPMQFKPDEVEFPVRISINVDEVRVLRDGSFIGVLSRLGDNVFRYTRSQRHRFEFQKPGYKSAELSTQGLGPLVSVTLQREPALVKDLGQPLSGGSCYDGGWLWVGTASGAILKLNPRTLDEEGRLAFPETSGVQKEVYSAVVPYTTGSGRKLLLFATKGGDCMAAEPGEQKPATVVAAGDPHHSLRSQPAIVKLSFFADKVFFLLPVGKRIKAVEAESRGLLWAEGYCQELPQNVTTTPSVVDLPELKLLVAGCEDGCLYSWNLRTGERGRAWTRQGAAVRTTPLFTGDLIVAGTADGSLLFLEPGGGVRGKELLLGGGVSSAPALERRTVYVGTSTLDGFYAVDLDRQAIQFAFTGEQIRGGVSCAPAIAGQRVYFGTSEGQFHAFEREDRGAEAVWSYFAPGAGAMVGPPVVAGKRVFFVCASGRIYAFDD